jgi:hypothetical protein
VRTALTELRRPFVLTAISLVLLGTHHHLHRTMAHGQGAHVLLGASEATPTAVAFLAVRLVTYVLVPGLMLAAAAEVIAYLLVGPRAPAGRGEPDHDST